MRRSCMPFNWLLCLGFGVAVLSGAAVAAQEPRQDTYWGHMLRAVKAHPAYAVYLFSKSAAPSLLSIEQARRYPKVEGIFSRTDGASSLTTTPSAWQAGLALSYPLYENYRQDARDQIAIAQGQQELAASAQNIESLIAGLANAHIRIWEASESIKILDTAGRHMKTLHQRVAEQVRTGEASLLMQSKFIKMDLDIKAKLLDAKQRLELASNTWAITGLPITATELLPTVYEFSETVSAHAKLQRLEAEFARVESEYALAERDEGPSVNLQVSILNRKYQSQSGWPSYHTWQVNATYPMFDGGLAKSRTRREALSLAGKSAELDSEKAQTAMEIVALRAGLASMKDIVAAVEVQCQLQRQIADSLLARFELGRGALVEITESFLSANDCSLTALQSRADYFTRYHELSRLDGTLARLILKEE